MVGVALLSTADQGSSESKYHLAPYSSDRRETSVCASRDSQPRTQAQRAHREPSIHRRSPGVDGQIRSFSTFDTELSAPRLSALTNFIVSVRRRKSRFGAVSFAKMIGLRSNSLKILQFPARKSGLALEMQFTSIRHACRVSQKFFGREAGC